jgi:GT2 family glycosyltransferase
MNLNIGCGADDWGDCYGAAFMIRRGIVQKTGLFDEGFLTCIP